MKSYKNKRVRSRRNKSRCYSRKRKGGETKIIGRTMGYRLFGKSNCKQLETDVRKEVENPNNKCNKIELSEKAEQQLNQCPEEEAYSLKNVIQNLIKDHNNQVINTCALRETKPIEEIQLLVNTPPSEGGKRRRHHRKSGKHSRRH